MPLVSIITTCYKHEKFIKETIESILSQTFSDWELLIWDDSPNDETRNIIQHYVKKYPDKIRARHHSPSKHIVGNTTFLFSQTSADSQYLAFLEWDDMWTPEYLSTKLKIFEQYPKVWLVYNELSIIDDKWVITEDKWIAPRTRKWYKNETDTIWNLIASDMVCFSYSTLMSRKFDWINIHNRWNQSLLGSESDFWLQIARKHNLYWIEVPLTLYRKHSSNTSKDLSLTIKHFDFFVQNYFSDGLITHKEYTNIQILIYMMKAFDSLLNHKYRLFITNVIHCFELSFFDTIRIWLTSVYYRLLKPYVFYFKNTLWKK